jgi:23S rRNA (guanosine2251-2'-O)-methyltransferase
VRRCGVQRENGSILPDNRDKPRPSGHGDEHAGGGKHRGKKPHFEGGHGGAPRPGGFHTGGFRPSGPRPGGFRPRGDRFEGGGPEGFRPEGGRAEGGRPEGSSFEGPRSFGSRPSGPRPGGFRPQGGRPEGPRPSYGAPRPSYGAPRPSYGAPFQGGPRAGGPRPNYGGPRPGGPNAGPRRGFGGPSQGGSRPNYGDRPEGQPPVGGPPREFGAPRPSYGAPRPGGPRSGGFGGPRPDGPRPDWRPAEREDQGEAAGPTGEWQPRNPWTPRPPHQGGARPGGPRQAYGAQRPGGPRRDFGPRPGGPRPGGPRSDRAGFGFGDRQADVEQPPAPPRDNEFDDAPPRAAGPHPGRFGEPASFDEVPPSEDRDAVAEQPLPDVAVPSLPEAAAQQRPIEPAPWRAPHPSHPDYRARSGGYPARRPFGPGQAAPGRFRPPAPPTDDLLGEDEEVIAGRHPVEEAFIAHRKAIRLLVVPQRRQALEKLVLHATNLRIPIVEVEGGTLTSLTGFDGHQGIALVTDKRQFAGLDDLLARAIERKEPPFVLVLDSLEDPQNFGSLLRTAEASGVHGVIFPTHRQAPLSAAAIKASAGAVEHLLLVPVEDLAEALADLHVRGLRIVGTDSEAPLTTRQADLRGPVAIVVGSEGQGLGPTVRRRCDTVVRIPMRGHVSSLNASVAGSILLYEASSQRGGDRPLLIADAEFGTDSDDRPADASSEPSAKATETPTVSVSDLDTEIASAEAQEPAAVESAPEAPAPRKRATRTRPAASRPAKASPSIPAEGDTPSGEGSQSVGDIDDHLLPG